MRKQLLAAGLLLALHLPLLAQTDRERSIDYTRRAVKLMDNGELDASLVLLDSAMRADTTFQTAIYESALAYYQKGDYAKTVSILEGIRQRFAKVSDAETYSLLGNAWDMLDKPDKALEIYAEGMKHFPHAGALYLESGVVSMKQKKLEQAMAFWEKGIEQAPRHASNYYWMARVRLLSPNKVMGLVYGEMFMALEPNSKRTAEMSALLYETYQKAIVVESKRKVSVSLVEEPQNVTIRLGEESSQIDFPFETRLESAYAAAAAEVLSKNKKIKEFGANEIVQMRLAMLDIWQKLNPEALQDYPLWSWQKKLQTAGHLETYTRWLLMKGDEDAFVVWEKANPGKFKAFAEWFAEQE